uniref:Uncharacterized protein n=1 Tax=Lactuca sativa TaxID=4236 RepID=A0A9R1XW65_LACSA|nr:hypothetical protein LSAT_V11C100000700 [Lactuca sativa]
MDSGFLSVEGQTETDTFGLSVCDFHSFFSMEHKTNIRFENDYDDDDDIFGCRIVSDCIPIKGRKRIPYLVIATLLSLFPWVVVGIEESIRNSRDQLMIFLLLQNLGSAMADVVIDAMIAEAARLEKAKFAGDLQSVSWMAMAVGGICGSLLGGYALTNFQMETIFLLFAVLPTLQLFSCAFVKETPVPKQSTSKTNGLNGSISVSDEDKSTNQIHNKTNTLRRKKSSKRKMNKSNSQILEKDPSGSFSSGLQWLRSLKLAGYTLFKAFRQPIILRYKMDTNFLFLFLIMYIYIFW